MRRAPYSSPEAPPACVKFFTIDEVAERLNVCNRTVRRWIEDKLLIAYKIGGVVRIAEDDLQAFLATHRDH